MDLQSRAILRGMNPLAILMAMPCGPDEDGA